MKPMEGTPTARRHRAVRNRLPAGHQDLEEDAGTGSGRRAASGLRTALLSAVGHDLRTPLTAIKAAASSLRDPSLRMSTADRQELLATVEESAERLAGLVDNLLDSSRLATGAVTPLTRPVGYPEVVSMALNHAVRADPAGADRVRVEVDETVPDVLADVGLAERVVANLVDNALRHGAGSPVAIRAGAHADRVELRIVDTGPGVPRNARGRLFTPFQRLGDRGTDTGVGLGLHIARGFAEAMGGTLTPEDTPGGGLTMVLDLPADSGPGPVTDAEGSRVLDCSASVEPTLTVGVSVVRVVGEVDLATVHVLTTALEQAAASSRRGIVVDLSEVMFCSVRGLQALVDAAARARGRRVHFALLGASPTIVRALQIGWPHAGPLHDHHP